MLELCSNESVNFLKNLLQSCKRKKGILKEKQSSAKKKQEFKVQHHSPEEQ